MYIFQSRDTRLGNYVITILHYSRKIFCACLHHVWSPISSTTFPYYARIISWNCISDMEKYIPPLWMELSANRYTWHLCDYATIMIAFHARLILSWLTGKLSFRRNTHSFLTVSNVLTYCRLRFTTPQCTLPLICTVIVKGKP